MFGRGTADMKGGDAAMLLVLEKLLEEQTIPEEPIYFCFTADEENQGIGIQAIEKSGELNTIREMIICEPSNEQISICEKGAVCDGNAKVFDGGAGTSYFAEVNSFRDSYFRWNYD